MNSGLVVGALSINSLNELKDLSKDLANSGLVPKLYLNKPNDIFVAALMGAQLGLTVFASLTGIAVINGTPTVWGDTMLGLVMGHPECEDVVESFNENATIWSCKVKRKGKSAVIRSFGYEDAKKANLINKPGPWTQYPHRMMQLRARAFALRDSFADVLKGIKMREEEEDIAEEKDITPHAEVVIAPSDALKEKIKSKKSAKALGENHSEQPKEPAPEEKEVSPPQLEHLEAEKSVDAFVDVPLSSFKDILMRYVSDGVNMGVIAENYLDKCLEKLGIESVTNLTYEQACKMINNIERKLREVTRVDS
jgi:hypothetical protein